METATHKMKKARRQGQTTARDVGHGCRGGSQVNRKATERVYAGRWIPKEWRMGLIVPIWKRIRGCA